MPTGQSPLLAEAVARQADVFGQIDLGPRLANQLGQVRVIIVVEHFLARDAHRTGRRGHIPSAVAPWRKRMAHRPEMFGRARLHIANAEVLEHAERHGR
jgi:hypothetical protein